MLIGEIATRTGLSPHTIRYYEKRGLFSSGRRHDNNYRDYPDDTVEILHAIVNLKKNGFTLEEIRQFIDLFTHAQRSCSNTAPLIEHRLEELTQRIRELQQLKGNLEKALASCKQHPHNLACQVLVDAFQ